MSATGLEVFDRTLHHTHEWLKGIMNDLGPDRQVAYRALRAVLHALRDRLSIEHATHFAAQLPLLLKGVYYDQWHVAGKPDKLRSREEFLARIAAEFGDARPIDPVTAARSVFRTIAMHVTPPEVEKIKSTLPKDIRALWDDDTADMAPLDDKARRREAAVESEPAATETAPLSS